MFTTFLKELGGYFDRRWLLSVFFPSLAFWSTCLLVYALAKGFGPVLELWGRQSSQIQVILIVAFLSWVTFFAALLGNFQTGIIRFFEGYWQTFPFTRLGNSRSAYYNRLLTYLDKRTKNYANEKTALRERISKGTDEERKDAIQALRELKGADRERLFFFPAEPDEVMPTRLGNIIRSAELYPWTRYGIDSVALWPRLHALLPAEFIETLLGAKTSMVFMLVMALLSFVFSLIVCMLLAVFTTNWLLFLFCALGWPLAWLCYKNSLGSALLYAELIKTAFDLHRWKLLEGLHLKRPTTSEEEAKTWEEVTYFVLRGYELESVKYDNAPPPPAAQSEPILFGDVVRAIKIFFADEEKAVTPPGETEMRDASAKVDAAQSSSPAAANSEPQPAPAQTVPAPAAVVGAQAPDEGRAEGAQDGRQEIGSPQGSTASNPRPRDFFAALYFGLFLALFTPAALLTGLKSKPQVQVPVVAMELPAYRLITPQALESRTVTPGDVAPNVLKDQKDIVGRYTLQTLAKGEMIHRGEIKELPDEALLKETTAVAIAATPAMILGGSLKAGDIVSLTIVPQASETQHPAALTLENILVLDVKPLPGQAAGSPAANRFLIVVALPTNRQQEFAISSANAHILVTRR
ncbi:MAG TPA: SAF domain-containing protein [Pyrinomonadaceae bacterium]|jgi:Flp pilus assembly protein CpaB|nr:SAF domain-containing protein [Pyrinomonadaceae bacterium]